MKTKEREEDGTRKRLFEAFQDYIGQDLYGGQENWEAVKKSNARMDELVMGQIQSNKTSMITRMATNYRPAMARVMVKTEPVEEFNPEIHKFSKSVSYPTIDEFLGDN